MNDSDKIYTKKGDIGTTPIGGQQHIPKSSLRVEALGHIDELNTCIGWAATSIRRRRKFASIREGMLAIQKDLFNLGSQLASPMPHRQATTPILHNSAIERLEAEIDVMAEGLKPLSHFILPGGSECPARLQIARATCRRTERHIIRLGESESLDGTEIPYLNRLSDWLFTAARHMNRLERVKEIAWP